jgi:long-chain acyl-CoA synthetase
MSYLMNACANGVTLVMESSFNAERTLALIERHRITHAYLVPTMYQRLLRHRAEGGRLHDISSIEQVASTGSPCAPEVKRAMIEWWGPVITEAYASSETGYLTFVDSTTWLARPGTAGRPVGNATVRILDDEGQSLPPGQTGLIYGRQPAYPDFTYIGNPSARTALERDGLFTLGDMGYLDEDGYLFINDRKSDMVISGGVNIYPAEIESVLHAMPGVADCAVFGIPDAEFGEALGAAVQPSPGATLDAASVQAFLRERIANYKVPRWVEFHEALPREDTGKIFKRLLREPHWRSQSRAI